MFPLNGGNLTMASSCVRSIVVIPCMLGLKLSMRVGLEHTSVSHVLRATVVLSTSISKWDKTVKPFLMLIWRSGREMKSLGVAGMGHSAERTQVKLKFHLSGWHLAVLGCHHIWSAGGQGEHVPVGETE